MIDDINNAVSVLESGGLILYPTDTIWGIGCDATNTEAVTRIYNLKKREDKKSMLVLIDTEIRLLQYVKDVPEIAWELIEASDKPLTIIYPEAKNLAANLVAEDGSIGIRIPDHDFCSRLIAKFRKPIVSTSANLSNEKSPQTFHEISEEIKTKVDYIVSYQQKDTDPGRVSTIIKLKLNGEFSILRQ
jgi:L-threonylcarbamoyladenylate synthase